MTLSDIGFIFRNFAWMIAAVIAGWALAPMLADAWRQRKQSREDEEFNDYLRRTDPDNQTKVLLKEIERDESLDPWK